MKRRRRTRARHELTSRLARTRWRTRLALAGVAAIPILLIALAFGVVETPDASGPVTDAADSLGAWTSVAIPSLAFLETGAFVGLFVPGDTAILVGGVVAQRGEVELPLLIALVWAAAVAGAVVSFLLGPPFGRPFQNHNPRVSAPGTSPESCRARATSSLTSSPRRTLAAFRPQSARNACHVSSSTATRASRAPA
jgi:hypothetical protein